ncbi:MAG: hypothetical protein ACK5O2_13365 [Microthrixaceae bacterium]
MAIVAASPAVVATITVAGSRWYPTADYAFEALRVSHVGGGDTPLVGVWSRWGYSHPGPWMLWVLAPFQRMLGDSGMLVGAGVVNSVACASAVLMASRVSWSSGTLDVVSGDGAAVGGAAVGGAPVGGAPVGGAAVGGEGRARRLALWRSAVVALATVAICAALGSSRLVDPWNPLLAVLPFWVFLVASWKATTGDRWAIPVMLVAGSFAAQTHISYLPIVCGMVLVTTVAMCLRARTGSGDSFPRSGAPVDRRPRWVLVGSLSATLMLILWLPPLVEQFTVARGNLGRIVDFTTSPVEYQWGLDGALRVAGHMLGPSVPWISGGLGDESGLALLGAPWLAPLVLAVLAMLAAVLGGRMRRAGSSLETPVLGPTALTSAVVAVSAVVLTVFTASRMAGVPGDYLVWPWVPVVALVAVSFGMVLLALVDRPVQRVSTNMLGVSSMALVSVASLATLLAGRPVSVPEPQASEVLSELLPELRENLDSGTGYLLAEEGPSGMALGPGIVSGLRDSGIEVGVRDEGLSEIQYGADRITTRADSDATLVVVDEGVLGQIWTPPGGTDPVAAVDPLSPSERQELSDALQRISEVLRGDGQVLSNPDAATEHEVLTAIDAGLPDDVGIRYTELQKRNWAVRVYVVPIAGDRSPTGG